jgi:photosystem II stability/assembly factor-like uncharacterized protein
MAGSLFLATDEGLVLARRDGIGQDSWHETGRGLAGRRVTSVTAGQTLVLAGTHDGIWRSTDQGNTWQEAGNGLTERHVRWLAHHPDMADRAFAGAEPAAVYVSYDGAASWRPCPEVAALRDGHHWSLPYSPEAGCVRGFAFHAARAYAAVEVGGVLRSDDTGETWRLADGSDGRPSFSSPPAPLVDPDVHSIAVHPRLPDLVDAPTGNGFYRSADGGQTWTCLYRCYCRAAWTDPADTRHIILGPASGVDRNGRIEESRDGGATWQPASHGLATPWRDHMVERFVQAGAALLAVLSNGELWSSPLAALSWQPLLPGVGRVASAAWLAG